MCSLSLSLVFLSPIFLNLKLCSQTIGECGTEPASDSLMATLPWYDHNEILDSFIVEGQKRLKLNIPINSRTGNTCSEIDGPLFLPIQFYWVVDHGELGPNPRRIRILIDLINDFYQQNGLPFQFYSGCSLELESPDNLYINSNGEAYAMYLGNHHAKAINVYVVDVISDALGVYNPVGDFITVTKDIFLGPNAASTLSHELGHFFGLEHTWTRIHHFQQCYREPVSRSKKFPWYCTIFAPFQVGKMCESNGDAICDTPADPNDEGQYGCPYLGTETDWFGDSFNPDIMNIMSRYRNGCNPQRTNLTNGQKGVIWYNLLTKHSELMELDAEYLNPDQFEPDNVDLTAHEIGLNESQCHSMHDYCRDGYDWLLVAPHQFIGSYYFDIEDALNSNNPVDDVKVFNRNVDGSVGSEIQTIRTSNDGLRRFEILCSSISSQFDGILIQVIRNNLDEGKYIASLRKSIDFSINNADKDCLSVGDVLSINNLPSGASVYWSGLFGGIIFNDPTLLTPTVTNIFGQPPLTVKAIISYSGCTETIEKIFHGTSGDPAPYFTIVEKQAPCKVHGIIYTSGYYETNPKLEVDWSIDHGTAIPDYGFFSSVKPDRTGLVNLTATYTNPCYQSRSVTLPIQVKNCDKLGPEIVISPNPNNGFFYISLTEEINNLSGHIITILDQYGNIKMQIYPTTIVSQVDASLLQDGVYYVNWNSNEFNYSRLVVINH